MDTIISNTIGFFSKLVRVKSANRKDDADAALSVAEVERIKSELSEKEDRRAWERAERIAGQLIPGALAKLSAVAESMSELYLSLLMFRFAKLTPEFEPKNILSQAKDETVSAFTKTLRACVNAAFYLEEDHVDLLSDFVALTEQALIAVQKDGATMTTTEDVFQHWASAFRHARRALRSRLDPLETLRSRALFVAPHHHQPEKLPTNQAVS